MTASLLLTLPELILTVGALALMLWAAWGGERATRGISVAAVALIAAAGAVVIAPPGGYGLGFDGLYRADAFSAFAKALIYLATAVSIIVAPRFFAVERLKPEYPVLILLATVGVGLLVLSRRR